MHRRAASWSDCWAMAIASWRFSSATFSSPLAEKKFVVNSSKKASRSSSRPWRSWCAVFSSSGPSGLLSDCGECGRDGRGEDQAVQLVLAVSRDVARHLSAAHGEPDEGDVRQVQVVDHVGQVVGEGVVVVGVTGVGLAEAAPVVGHHAVPRLRQGLGLCRPRRVAQRPSVDQHDGSAVPAGVEDGEVVGLSVRCLGHVFDANHGTSPGSTPVRVGPPPPRCPRVLPIVPALSPPWRRSHGVPISGDA